MSGSENSKPVHIGNAVYNQKQNNSLGYLMDVIYNYYLLFSGNLDKIEGMWKIIRNIAKTVIAEWQNKDQCICQFYFSLDLYIMKYSIEVICRNI